MARRRSRTMELPRELVRAEERFEKWRATRNSRTERIPEPLWAVAVRLARKHGTWRTARALRLESATLKRRVEGMAPERTSRRSAKPTPGPTFVELFPPQNGGGAECLMEVESTSGLKLRIQVRGADGVLLASLASALVEGRGE